MSSHVHVLPDPLRERIEACARACYPREACGLLLGRRAAGRLEIVDVREARNLAAERAHERFELDPVDHLAAEEHAAAHGLEVVGVWHSHPDRPARPSAADRATAWAGWLHLIVSVARGEPEGFRAWSLVDGDLVEQQLTG